MSLQEPVPTAIQKWLDVMNRVRKNTRFWETGPVQTCVSHDVRSIPERQAEFFDAIVLKRVAAEQDCAGSVYQNLNVQPQRPGAHILQVKAHLVVKV